MLLANGQHWIAVLAETAELIPKVDQYFIIIIFVQSGDLFKQRWVWSSRSPKSVASTFHLRSRKWNSFALLLWFVLWLLGFRADYVRTTWLLPANEYSVNECPSNVNPVLASGLSNLFVVTEAVTMVAAIVVVRGLLSHGIIRCNRTGERSPIDDALRFLKDFRSTKSVWGWRFSR